MVYVGLIRVSCFLFKNFCSKNFASMLGNVDKGSLLAATHILGTLQLSHY